MEFKTKVTAHKNGTYSLGINLNYGFMTPDELITLGELAKKHGVKTMMATTAKKISFFDVAEDAVNPLWDDIVATFGDTSLRTPKGKIIVCPGKEYCKFAMPGFDGHAMADEITKISQAHDAGAKLKVGVSTCPRCCSMAKVRDLGVFAAAKGWTITLGGNGASKPTEGTVLATNLSDEEAIALIDKIYAYIEANKEGTERSTKLFNRIGGFDELKKALGLEE